MDLDTEVLAQKLYDRSLSAHEVSFADVRPMLQGAPYGIGPLDEPDLYRWFLIEKFPVEDFGITIEGMLEEAGPRHSDDLWRHNRIVDLLREVKPAWPAFATATGIVIDGYHRIAAHRTLKDRDMSVVVAVERKGSSAWDEIWNEAFPPARLGVSDIESTIVYHGTKDRIRGFESTKTVDGGFHFGTRDQAVMRAGRGGTLIGARLDIRKPRRLQDQGGRWRAQILSAKRAGYDGIVYLNRFEGISRSTVERAYAERRDLNLLSDEDFRSYAPEAQDSYIAFYPPQIRVVSVEEI